MPQLHTILKILKLKSLSQVERAEFYGAQVASISFLIKKENNNNEEPQYEINLPALLISFLKCFSFLL